ncbi:MAG: ribonuclease P protein component [Trueperaceae bacterium]
MQPSRELPLLTSLKGDRAFRRLRKGQAGHSKYLSVRVLPGRQVGIRIGIVVSKKVGKAVVRNRVRRRLKESFRSFLDKPVQSQLNRGGTPAFDVVVVTQPEAAEASYWQLRGALEHSLRKAGVFKSTGDGVHAKAKPSNPNSQTPNL